MKKKRGKPFYNETSNPVSMLARGRVDGYNEAVKDMENCEKCKELNKKYPSNYQWKVCCPNHGIKLANK